nr:ribonuclease H-like domain-containing protein [Tanacetum cinerariifolium]
MSPGSTLLIDISASLERNLDAKAIMLAINQSPIIFTRYKARLVANVRSEQFGVDCEDTFSPVVKPDTINTVLSLT